MSTAPWSNLAPATGPNSSSPLIRAAWYARFRPMRPAGSVLPIRARPQADGSVVNPACPHNRHVRLASIEIAIVGLAEEHCRVVKPDRPAGSHSRRHDLPGPAARPDARTSPEGEGLPGWHCHRDPPVLALGRAHACVGPSRQRTEPSSL